MNIKFNNLKLFGYHGVFEEEKILGNNFILNIKLEIADKKNTNIQTLKDVVDYGQIFKIIHESFKQREDLLEKVNINIATHIFKNFSSILIIEIEISKEKMYLENFTGSISVVQKFNRNEQ